MHEHDVKGTPYALQGVLERPIGIVLQMSWTIFYTSLFFFCQDNKDLYAEEAAAQRERERQRMLSIPGLIAPNEIQDEMLDS